MIHLGEIVFHNININEVYMMQNHTLSAGLAQCIRLVCGCWDVGVLVFDCIMLEQCFEIMCEALHRRDKVKID